MLRKFVWFVLRVVWSALGVAERVVLLPLEFKAAEFKALLLLEDKFGPPASVR